MIEVIIPSKIETEKIFFKLEDSDSTKRIVESFDYVPYIYIKKINDPIFTPPIDGTNVDPRDINYVKLYNNKFLPEIELSCEDSKGLLLNNVYPFDHDTLLCIFIKSNSENTFPIRMDFRVTEYESIKSGDNSRLKYIIKGILNVDELHYIKYEAYEDTSFNVLKNIAKNFKLGFATNVSSSDDKMKWINPADTYLNFIKDISRHAYIGDDSFIWTFIDFYYNLNYVDVQKQINEFNKDEISNFRNTQLILNDKERSVYQYLTNNTAFNMTNKYITKFNLVNQSFKQNIQNGYNKVVRWYDQKDATIYKENLEKLINDDSGLSPGEGKLMQLIDENSDISTNNFIKVETSKLDPDNCHKKYIYAETLNVHNLNNINKMKMVVTLRQINFDIKRFQNIKVEIFNIEQIGSRTNTKSDKATEDKEPLQNINERLSGYWYVTGINYIYRRTGGPEQEITLMRRDLSKNYGEGDTNKNDLREATKNN